MSWNRRDYDGETDAIRREYEDEIEQLALDREEREERELLAAEEDAEPPVIDEEGDALFAAQCAEFLAALRAENPLHAAFDGWLRAVTNEARRAA